jgi:hypothetical protein
MVFGQPMWECRVWHSKILAEEKPRTFAARCSKKSHATIHGWWKIGGNTWLPTIIDGLHTE